MISKTQTGALLGLVGFGFSAFVLSAGHAQAQSQPHISHALPVSVVNTPGVTIQNTPSVSLSGTPTVNVGTLPAVQLSGTPTVQIGNTSVPVHLVDGGVPFFHELAGYFSAGDGAVVPDATWIYTVPSGKRLVIEDVSYLSAELNLWSVTLTITTPDAFYHGVYLPIPAKSGISISANAPLHLVADSGSVISFQANRSDASAGGTSFQMSVDGRLEDQ